MERKLKSFTLGMSGALLMLGTTLLAPLAAHAGADGRKNTAIALGAGAAYELLLKHQVAPALVLGAGAAYAGKRYEDARRSERDQNNRYYYRNGYPNGPSSNRDNYNNNGGYYNNNGGYHNNNNGYSNGYNNNGYDNHDNDNRDNQRQGRRHDRDDNNRSQDNQHGNKRGWNGRDLPPGQEKHRHHNDDNR